MMVRLFTLSLFLSPFSLSHTVFPRFESTVPHAFLTLYSRSGRGKLYAGSMTQEAREPTRAPTPIEVFWTFLYVGATAMGGGAGAHIREAVVRRRGWITEIQFLEGMTLARLMPGPVISNLASFLGAKLAGPGGALAATLGMILPGTCLMLGLAGAYFGARNLQNPVIEGVLHGIAAAAVGVMAALVIQTAPAGLRVRGGVLIAAIVLVLSLVFHWSVLGVLTALFPVALLLNRPREDGNG